MVNSIVGAALAANLKQQKEDIETAIGGARTLWPGVVFG